MSSITNEQVAHLAQLARISLNPEEVAHMTVQLEQIMTAVARVNEVATPDVPLTSHPIPLPNVYRDDVLMPTLSQAQVLAAAPESRDGRFLVSAILGEEQ